MWRAARRQTHRQSGCRVADVVRTLTAVAALPLLAVACKSAGPPTAATPAAAPTARAAHILRLHTADDDAALAAWVTELNADCGDTVKAYVPPGTVTLQTTAFLSVASVCANPARQVEIFGAGADSSIIQVASTVPDGGGGIGLMIADPHVRVHDIGFRSLADALVWPPDSNNGNSDEAVKFIGAPSGAAASGEADHLRIEGFRTAAVDVWGAPQVSMHDNVVLCPAMVAPNYEMAMGLWMRNLPNPPPPGTTNGSIVDNQVMNCGDSGINIGNASYVSILGNTLSCVAGACPRGEFIAPKRAVLGIILFADHVACNSSVASYDIISGNTIHGRNSIGTGIVIEGAGAGQFNLVEANAVDSTVEFGVVVSNYGCPGQPNTAFMHNKITRNVITDVLGYSGNDIVGYGIWNGGDSDVISYNRVCPVSIARNIVDESGTAIIDWNDSATASGCVAPPVFHSN